MEDRKQDLPKPTVDLKREVYAMRMELHYFKKDFKDNFRHSGCISVKISRQWIRFLTLSNTALWTAIAYLIFRKH